MGKMNQIRPLLRHANEEDEPATIGADAVHLAHMDISTISPAASLRGHESELQYSFGYWHQSCDLENNRI